ncbi:MAG: ATP-binding protein [Actinomycetota bacterium]
MNEILELEVPAAPEFVGTARLFAAEAVRQFGADEETAADLKIAISEACTGAIAAQAAEPAESPVRLSIEQGDDFVKIEVVGASGFEPVAQTPPTGGLGINLVQALFPGAEFIKNAGRACTLRIQVPV